MVPLLKVSLLLTIFQTRTVTQIMKHFEQPNQFRIEIVKKLIEKVQMKLTYMSIFSDRHLE